MSVTVIKPYWVHHKGSPIFSVDVHPDNTRFATCGEDRSIRIWNMAPVVDQQIEVDNKAPKKLCELTNHTNSVNCIRWSPKGEFLASASADGSLLIFQKGDGPSSSFGDREAFTESWECIFTGTAHQSDVEDLAWSPDSKYLASASLDITIIIWRQKSHGKFEKHRVLKTHKNWVKGISFDPLGKYLASQGAEGCMTLWTTKHWTAEKIITNNFVDRNNVVFQDSLNSNKEVVFSRPSWSPDGSYVGASFGKTSGVYISPIFERGSWNQKAMFVGHGKPTTATVFGPTCYRKDGQTFSISAVGSMDQSVSFWASNSTRPKLVLEDIFQSSIIDVRWNASGTHCFACSHDGTLAVFAMDEDWFDGKALSPEELARHIQNVHGDLLEDAEIWEDADIMILAQKYENGIQENVNMLEAKRKQKTPVVKKPQKQEEFRDAKGRRRIVPEMVQSPGDGRSPVNETVPVTSLMERLKNNQPGNACKKKIDLLNNRLGEASKGFELTPVNEQKTAEKITMLIPRRKSEENEKINILQPRRKDEEKVNILSVRRKEPQTTAKKKSKTSEEPSEKGVKRKLAEVESLIQSPAKRKRLNFKHKQRVESNYLFLRPLNMAQERQHTGSWK